MSFRLDPSANRVFSAVRTGCARLGTAGSQAFQIGDQVVELLLVELAESRHFLTAMRSSEGIAQSLARPSWR